MRRVLGFLTIGLLVAGTAGACSSDDEGGSAATTASGGTATTAATGDAGGNPDITAFCDTVDDFIGAAEAFADDPTTDAEQTFTELGQQLETDGAALEAAADGFDEADAARFEACNDLRLRGLEDDSAGNADVQAYCDALQAMQDDPTNPDLITQVGQLATDLGAASLSAEDSQQMADCQAQFAAG